MNQFDFAMSLIRAPFFQKLKDKTFQVLIGTAFAATTAMISAWQTAALPISDKLNVTFIAFGAWAAIGAAFTIGDKAKDATIAKAAIESSKAPETIAAGGDVSVGSTPRPADAIDEAVEWRDEMPGDVPQGYGAPNVPREPVVEPLEYDDREARNLQAQAVIEQEAQNGRD